MSTGKALHVKQCPNPRVLSVATAFYNATRALARAERTSDSGVPIIVNGTFALELYLKCLNSDLRLEKPVRVDEDVTAFGYRRRGPVDIDSGLRESSEPQECPRVRS